MDAAEYVTPVVLYIWCCTTHNTIHKLFYIERVVFQSRNELLSASLLLQFCRDVYIFRLHNLSILFSWKRDDRKLKNASKIS